MTLRQVNVMSRIFVVVVGLVTVWLAFLFINNAINPPKPKTAAEVLHDLQQGRDHSVSPHLAKLFNATAHVQTKWNGDGMDCVVDMDEGGSQLKEYIEQHPDYAFMVTWFDGDKPMAQALVPFSNFKPAESGHDHESMTGSAHKTMQQAEYEKIYNNNSWGIDWGAVKRQ